jgi:hypothetical protein
MAALLFTDTLTWGLCHLNELYENYGSFFRFFRQHWKRIVLRAHKDRRSLAALLLLVGIVSYVSIYGYYLLKNPVSLLMLGLAIFVTWRIRKSHKKDDETLVSFSTYKPINVAPTQAAVMTLRTRTLGLWLLVWRGSSENFLRTNEVPEGQEVLTRRIILSKLRELNLLDDLSERERNLHFLPDGAWSDDDISPCLFRRSELEVFQYATGIVDSLIPIEDFDKIQQLSIDQIQNITPNSNWKPRETFDLRRERDMSATFYLRCLGEQVRRGTVEATFEQEEREAIDGANQRAGDENADFLIGTKIISDAGDLELILGISQSYLRFTALQQTLTLLEPSPDVSTVPRA